MLVLFYYLRFFFMSLRYFNQLDATSKVMYRHEIICTQNIAKFNCHLLVSEQCSTWLPDSVKFVNKANDIEIKKKTTHNHLKLFEYCVVRDSGLFRGGTVCL